jgi:tRNA pseudouridine38-40 synthase
VHALAMTAHVDIGKPITAHRLADGANAKLRPLPVAILAAEEVSEDFHARFSCIGRRYVYRIANRRAPLALEAGRAWRVPVLLAEEDMNDAAQVLVGHHDFTTFRSAHCQAESPVKTLDRLSVRRLGETIEIEAAARSFLHHQVRSMVGCLELVGRGKWTKADLKAALDAADRAALGFNAPPDGLYFAGALYPGA